jgi:hypothetical protein
MSRNDTEHLLRSPANAKRLRRSINELSARTPEMQAALMERARIVAWLRGLGPIDMAVQHPQSIADAIERGDHLITKAP